MYKRQILEGTVVSIKEFGAFIEFAPGKEGMVHISKIAKERINSCLLYTSEAKPSTPVEILGLNSVPSAGETFVACDSEKEAKAFSDTYISEEKNKLIEDTKAKMSLDDLFSQIQSGDVYKRQAIYLFFLKNLI